MIVTPRSPARIRTSFLPSLLPSSTLSLLSPDMLVIQGLSLSWSSRASHDGATHHSTRLCRIGFPEGCLLSQHRRMNYPLPVMNYTTRPLRERNHNTTLFLVASHLSEGWKIALPSIPLLAPDQPPPRSPSCFCPLRTSHLPGAICSHSPLHTLLHHPPNYTCPLAWQPCLFHSMPLTHCLCAVPAHCSLL